MASFELLLISIVPPSQIRFWSAVCTTFPMGQSPIRVLLIEDQETDYLLTRRPKKKARPHLRAVETERPAA